MKHITITIEATISSREEELLTDAQYRARAAEQSPDERLALIQEAAQGGRVRIYLNEFVGLGELAEVQAITVEEKKDEKKDGRYAGI